MLSTPMTFLRAWALTLAAMLLAGTAQAADAAHISVRGAITSVSQDGLSVHTRRGEDLNLKLVPDTQVRGVTLGKVEDIKPGSYIGSAAIHKPDGTLKALEVHVFPPEMAGTGEGYRAFDLAPGSTMTNGSVGDLVTQNGRILTVNYKGGTKMIEVPENVPIVNLVPGDRSLLKPGVQVVLFAHKDADGGLTALAISAGKDGVTPPM